MKTKQLLVISGSLLLLVGCRTQRGGSMDTYQTTYGTGYSAMAPSGETIRQGMNPRDIRDSSSITKPFQPFPGVY